MGVEIMGGLICQLRLLPNMVTASEDDNLELQENRKRQRIPIK